MTSAATIDGIQKVVAQHFALEVADLKGRSRRADVVRPRMVAMYLVRELTGESYPQIGLRFGGMDHSTVMHACKRIEELKAGNSELITTIAVLRKRCEVAG